MATDFLQIGVRSVLLSTGFLADASLALRSGLFTTSHSIPGPAEQIVAVTEVVRTGKGEWKQPLVFATAFVCATLIIATIVAVSFEMMEKHSVSTLFSAEEFSTPAIVPILITCAFFSAVLLAYAKKHASTSPAWMGRAGGLMCDVVFMTPLVGLGLAAGRKLCHPERGTKTMSENLGSFMAGGGIFVATYMASMLLL